MLQLDYEISDEVNITQAPGALAVLTHTPSATEPKLCQVLLKLGTSGFNGALDLTGGNFKLYWQIGAHVGAEHIYTLPAGIATCSITSPQFLVPTNTAVVIYIVSPNGADTTVDVYAWIYDVQGGIAKEGADGDTLETLSDQIDLAATLIEESQAAAKVALRVPGNVYFLASVASGGNDANDGLRWNTPKTVSQANIAALTVGQAAIIMGGTHTLSAQTVITDGTKVVGSGMDVTILTGSLSNKPLVVPGDQCYLADMTIVNSAAATGYYSAAVGSMSVDSNHGAVDALIERVKMVGADSAFNWQHFTGSEAFDITFVDCVFDSQREALCIFSCPVASQVIVVRGRIKAESAVLPTLVGVANDSPNCTIWLHQCDVYAKATFISSWGVGVSCQGGPIIINGGRLVGIGKTQSYDIYVTGESLVPPAMATTILSGVEYDRTKTYVNATYGTLIERATDNQVTPTAAAVTTIQSGLATSANQTTILNRLGAWTGSGVNSILGAIRAMLRKDVDATLPSDIGGTFLPSTDSAEAIQEQATTIATAIDAVPTAAENKTAMEADGSKLDHLWETTEDNAGTRRFTAAGLAESPSGGLDAAGVRSAIGMAAADLDDQLAAIGTSLGTGARTVTITVDDGTDPLESARVRLTKGAETYVGSTNASGQIVFSVDDGTWAVAVALVSHTFTPTTIVVNGDETQTYSMTAVTLPASDVDKVTGYLYAEDNEGTREAGVDVTLTLHLLAGSGLAVDSEARTETSDAEGLVAFTGLTPGATYKLMREGGTERLVIIPSTATVSYLLPSVKG